MTNINFRALLDNSDFNNKINQVNTKLQETQQRAAEAGRKLAIFGTAIAAAAGAMATLVISSAKQAQELRRMSQVANTGVKEFQAFAFAARSVGIEQDKLADILKDVNDRVGDFLQTGGGPMADFFENIAPKVGVTADEFRNLSGADALGLYVSTLQEAGVSQQEMTFYMEALASDATMLAPLLADNGAELGKLTEQYRALNIELDNTDISTLTEAGNGIAMVSAAITGLADQLAVAVAPAVTAVADALVGMLTPGAALRDLFDGLVNNIGRLATYAMTAAGIFAVQWVAGVAAAAAATMTLGGALVFLRAALVRTGIGALIVLAGELVYQFLVLVEKTGGFGNALAALAAVATEVWGRIKQGASLMGEAIYGVAMTISAEFSNAWVSVLEGFANLLAKIQGGINTIKTALNEAFTFKIPEIEIMGKKFGGQVFEGLGLEASTFADEYSGKVSEMRAETDALAESARIYNESVRNSAGELLAPLESIAALRETTAGAADEAERLTTAFSGGGVGTGEAPGGGGGAKAEEKKSPIQDWVDSMKQGVDEIGTMIQNTYTQLEDALVSFVRNGKLDFSSLIDSMINDLIRFSLRSMLFGTDGGGGGLFGNLFSGGGFLSGLFSGIASRNGNAFGSSGQLNYAMGGVFNQKFAMPTGNGRMAIGAEAGPEAIMPLQRGSDGRLGVVATAGGYGGGQTVVNNFNTTINPGSQTSPQDARKFAAEFNRAVEVKVMETIAKRQNTGIGGRRFG